MGFCTTGLCLKNVDTQLFLKNENLPKGYLTFEEFEKSETLANIFKKQV